MGHPGHVWHFIWSYGASYTYTASDMPYGAIYGNTGGLDVIQLKILYNLRLFVFGGPCISAV